MRELAARARDRKLLPDDYQGGASTISNLGMYGVREFSAIINPPHGTILAVGAARRQAVEQDDGSAKFVSMVTVTLSCDHRVVDGALGAELLAAFKTIIEHPLRHACLIAHSSGARGGHQACPARSRARAVRVATRSRRADHLLHPDLRPIFWVMNTIPACARSASGQRSSQVRLCRRCCAPWITAGRPGSSATLTRPFTRRQVGPEVLLQAR